MALTFGLVPVDDDAATRESLDELRGALGAALGEDVECHLAASPQALARGLSLGAVDLCWASPTLVLTAPELRTAVPIASSVREGVAHYHGVLFVRRDSRFSSPLALRGARAAWVAETSAGGYIFPRVALAGHGIDPDEIFREQRFYGSHGAVARAVLGGEADVGATFAVFMGGDASAPLRRSGFGGIDGGEWARVLLATPAIPADLMVASRGLAEFMGAERLLGALGAARTAAPDAVRRVLGVDSFAACDRRSLEELRRQLDDARALSVI